jgi:hypothetical protein
MKLLITQNTTYISFQALQWVGVYMVAMLLLFALEIYKLRI